MRKSRRYAAAVCVCAAAVAFLGYAVQADVLQVPTGTWAAGGPFGEIPKDAASAVLVDGRLVVAGGSASDGQPSAQIAIYNPASGEWTIAGNMSEARAGHTATALADGRVLIAGGRTSAGVTSSIELYNPVTGASTAARPLSLPRVHHAAARLIDKRVLIVGGSDGNAALASAEMFDPETGSIAPLSASLSTPRMKLSATTLLDGHVLVAGGNDGAQDLATTEMFYAEYGVFLPTSSMGAPRSGHVAVLLPNNNSVLIAGGSSNGTPLASVERFAHWFESEMFYPDANAMAAARTGALAVPTPREGVVLVGGGGSADAELYGFATVKTDKDDYAPYETVTISGGGWQPGETVHLRVTEDSDSHYDWELEAIADEFGNIINTDFYPREDEQYHHIGMRFYMMAQGIASEAQMTFTDAAATNTAATSSPNPSTPGQNVTVTATVTSGTSAVTEGVVKFYYGGQNCTGNPGTQFGSVAGVSLDGAGQAGAVTTVLTNGVRVRACYGGAGSGSSALQASEGEIIQNVSPSAKSNQTITFGALAAKTYGDADFGVTATASSGLPVMFTASGQCELTGATVHILGVGSCDVTATQGGNAEYNAAPSVLRSFTIAKKAASVTPMDASKVYGALDPVFTGELAGFLAADGVSADYSRTAGETVAGGPYTISGMLNPAGMLGNYTITYNTANFTITPKAASVTPTDASKVYGALDPVFTGELAGFLAADGVSADYSRMAGETVAGGPYTISATLNPAGVLGNYTITYNTANFTISPKAASVTPTDASKVYGALDPVFTGELAGFLAADGVSADYSRTAGETVAGGPYTISATLNPAGVLGNYTITYNTANFTISPKAASVTPTDASKVYGALDPVFTGELAGFLAADGVSADYSRTAGETVAGGPYTISATLNPAGVLGNYTITYNTANFTITPKAASVTPTDASKVYGALDPVFTGELAGFLAADGVSADYSRTAGETVAGGPYTISATLNPAGVLGNYTITYNTANFTITPKAASVTPSAASKTYGAADPVPFTGTLNGFLAADGVSATYSRAAGETVADGPYTISATLSPAGILSNYDITYNTANFTITPKAASVTPNAASKTYGAADPVPFTGTLNGFLAADGMSATYSRAAGETVAGGPYTISATLSPAGILSNYDITYNTANFTITPKAASVTPNDASKILGAADPVFDGTLNGFLEADGVIATYSRAAGETVAGNPYTISAKLSPAGVLSNYAITYNTASFTILYKWDGFLQPINDTAHDLGPMSKFKAGQTIPAKFVLKNVSGVAVQQSGNPTFTRTVRLGACDSAAALESPELVSADVVPLYKWDGIQYHYNWSTKGLTGGLYRIFANLADGTAQSVDICLTK